ncbi:TRAP-type C4-dicarboxylate transport system, substrate-binding protein [Raineyella antarctica]|uniref:TRAP-type C4-dicarboxylate transport system, substrate-binding protein n=1 Tax=Raineyella antarctica TaxID=1577474 RepID=A0A1G6GJ21_9ACTN|nr:TRAP transporter substrate-binding protein DctP [Raineyella antarctica]SDB81919.1 TRAP-type C4-dicarboxylate transport system, substrate-binding protein [Raineyella antarctica]
MKKRIGAAVIAALTSVALAACGQSGTSTTANGEHAPVTLSFITGNPEDHPISDGFWMFRDKLAQTAPWVKIDYKGGPEVMAPNLMVEGVQSGAYDGASLPSGYYASQVPAVELARFTPFSPTEERDDGVFDIYAKIHEKQGLHLAGRTYAGVPQVILLKDKIDKPDLTGLNLRTSPDASGPVKALGGTPVDMPAGEVYSALERGVIDGATFTSTGVVSLGWQEHLGYYVEPRFYDSVASTVINLDKWDSLDKETQDAITQTMKDVEPEVVKHYQELAAKETKAWQDAGMKQIHFQGADEKKVMDAAYRTSFDALDWKRIAAASPEAEQIRAKYEETYGSKDLVSVVPGSAVIQPKA